MNCDHFHDLLDAHLDGELAGVENRALMGHAAACHACAAELDLGRRLLDELRNAPPTECPDAVLEASLERISRNRRARATDRAPLRSAPLARRALYGLAALAGLVALSFLLLRPRTAERTYSAEEIAEARQQVEFAFRLVGEAGHSAGLYLREDVFPAHVLGPLGRTLNQPEPRIPSP